MTDNPAPVEPTQEMRKAVIRVIKRWRNCGDELSKMSEEHIALFADDMLEAAVETAPAADAVITNEQKSSAVRAVRELRSKLNFSNISSQEYVDCVCKALLNKDTDDGFTSKNLAIDATWLRRKNLEEGDTECEAGILHPEANIVSQQKEKK